MSEQPSHNDFVNAAYMLYRKTGEHRGPFHGNVATMAAAEGWQTSLGGDEEIDICFCLTRQIFAWLHPGGVWSGGTLRCPDGDGEDSWWESQP